MSERSSDDELIALAQQARQAAYAPYSNYRVGCALRSGDATVTGANVENASYGLTICAERVACAIAALSGVRAIEAIAVVTDTTPPAAPCGMCLQTLIEFSSDPKNLHIILVNLGGDRRDFTLADLIPQAFDKTQLTP